MLRLFLVAFTCLLTQVVFGQFSDSISKYIRFSTTGIINRTQDSKSFVINNAIVFNVNKPNVTFNSSSAWIYGRQNDLQTNNDVNSVMNFDVLKNVQRLYYWGLGSFVRSYSLQINHQFQIGAGLGFNAIQKKNVELVITDGILYEASSLQTDTGTKENYQTARNSLRIKHRWLINELISIEGSHFWQPSLKSADDYIIRSTATLGLKLKKWLSLTSAFSYNKISKTGRENLLLNFGLTAEKYF